MLDSSKRFHQEHTEHTEDGISDAGRRMPGKSLICRLTP